MCPLCLFGVTASRYPVFGVNAGRYWSARSNGFGLSHPPSHARGQCVMIRALCCISPPLITSAALGRLQIRSYDHAS
eukprot:15473411-Alexandrium_andersonii.AAC.1